MKVLQVSIRHYMNSNHPVVNKDFQSKLCLSVIFNDVIFKTFATFLLFYADCQFMQNRKTNFKKNFVLYCQLCSFFIKLLKN